MSEEIKILKSYIYVIRNLINDKIYVGKSNNPKIRWSDHKKIATKIGKEKYKKSFSAIHSAIIKYGLNNFIFEVIDEFDNEIDCYRGETKWILLLCSNIKEFGYNCNLGGKGSFSPTETTRQKMRDIQNSPEVAAKRSNTLRQMYIDNPNLGEVISNRMMGNTYCKGITLTKEHKQKCSDSLRGRVFTEEHKRKKSEAQTGSKHSQAKLNEEKVIEILDLYKTGSYTQLALSNIFKVHRATINDIIKNKTWVHIKRN